MSGTSDRASEDHRSGATRLVAVADDVGRWRGTLESGGPTIQLVSARGARRLDLDTRWRDMSGEMAAGDLSIVRLPCDGPERTFRIVLRGLCEVRPAVPVLTVIVPEAMSGGPPHPRELAVVAEEGLLPGVDLDCSWVTATGVWVAGADESVEFPLDTSDAAAAMNLATLISKAADPPSGGLAGHWLAAIAAGEVPSTRSTWTFAAASLFMDRVVAALSRRGQD